MNGIELDVRGEGHDIVIDPSAKLRGSRLRVKDDNCRVHIGANVSGKWDLTVSRGGTLTIGAGTTCESAVIAAQTERIVIGSDCMLSFSIEIRTTDTHAIYDVDTGERVNPDQPVVIGDHVWLAKQAVVLKGTTIGSGSVIGTRALASGTFPALSLSAGVPARVLRENVTWTRRVGKGQLDLDPEAMAVVTTVRMSA
jgi:acetyltransferase-like isoleucine patch superfamily enzyme